MLLVETLDAQGQTLHKLLQQFRTGFRDDNFLGFLGRIERFVTKILSVAMVLVILVAVYDLTIFLVRDFLVPELATPSFGHFSVSLFKIFGLFLNILIALEILENITAYLKKHVVQVELVIVTSLIAVARKIIILDLETTTAADLVGLSLAIFSLAASYWMIKRVNRKVAGSGKNNY